MLSIYRPNLHRPSLSNKMLSWKYHRRGPVVLNDTEHGLRGGTGAVSVNVCVSIVGCSDETLVCVW